MHAYIHAYIHTNIHTEDINLQNSTCHLPYKKYVGSCETKIIILLFASPTEGRTVGLCDRNVSGRQVAGYRTASEETA